MDTSKAWDKYCKVLYLLEVQGFSIHEENERNEMNKHKQS